MDLTAFLKHSYWGNTLFAYLVAAVTFVLVVWGFLFGRKVVLGRLRAWAQKTATDLDDFAVELLGKIKTPECYLLGFYIATRPLRFDARVDRLLRSFLIVVVAYRAVTMLQAAVAYGLKKAMIGEESDQARRDTVKTLTLLVQGLVWVGAVIFVLDNLGFNVGSMVAGLGIGGVAVALAAQAVLGDLFAALAIFLDRPFVVGDFIVVGEAAGTVERIGIKTTRIRSLSGELLVMGNSQLTSSRIHNYKKMRDRRIVFRFGLLYSTTEKQLAEVPGIVKALVGQDKLLRFDRAHFMNFGDSSLDFEVVYYVEDPDYNKYMDCHQRLLLGLVRELGARGLGFAFPTRTLSIEGPVAVKSA
ncbi:MAG: mechanosensitive ion channel family protein [Elusimicrobia bacterium]|nr:mechanosensitive ion channel family protein [Elusimicrobiota bacterium]